MVKGRVSQAHLTGSGRGQYNAGSPDHPACRLHAARRRGQKHTLGDAMNIQTFVRKATLCMTVLLLACSKPPETAKEAPKTAEPTASVTPGEMVKIDAGDAVIGSDVDPTGGKRLGPYSPAHTVKVADFWMDKYEVTNGDFLRFVTANDYRPEGNWRKYYQFGNEKYPVTNVTLDDARVYCEWVRKRLPTEEEWEKAARGPKNWDYTWGESWQPGKANTSESGNKTMAPVGETAGDVSAYGVHDMYGNLQEWTDSRYKAYPGGPPNPDFQQGMYSVRGTSWNSNGSVFRLWWRSGFVPRSEFGIGFRCASSTEPVQ
jgi:formylglycine-generating enzyme required for sulfatase activity